MLAMDTLFLTLILAPDVPGLSLGSRSTAPLDILSPVLLCSFPLELIAFSKLLPPFTGDFGVAARLEICEYSGTRNL